MQRATDPGNQPPAFPKRRGSAPGSGVVAWIAAGVGMSLFALAGVGLVAHLITEELFWRLSVAGLASYFCAHCLGVSYHS